MLNGNEIKVGQKIKRKRSKSLFRIDDVVFKVIRKVEDEPKKMTFEGIHIYSKELGVGGKIYKEDYEKWEVVDGKKK